jgi:hypothetical protein
MSDLKLCVNCKYFVPEVEPSFLVPVSNRAYCSNEKNMPISLVLGYRDPRYSLNLLRDPEFMISPNTVCGVDGSWFEDKS